MAGGVDVLEGVPHARKPSPMATEPREQVSYTCDTCHNSFNSGFVLFTHTVHHKLYRDRIADYLARRGAAAGAATRTEFVRRSMVSAIKLALSKYGPMAGNRVRVGASASIACTEDVRLSGTGTATVFAPRRGGLTGDPSALVCELVVGLCVSVVHRSFWTSFNTAHSSYTGPLARQEHTRRTCGVRTSSAT